MPKSRHLLANINAGAFLFGSSNRLVWCFVVRGVPQRPKLIRLSKGSTTPGFIEACVKQGHHFREKLLWGKRCSFIFGD